MLIIKSVDSTRVRIRERRAQTKLVVYAVTFRRSKCEELGLEEIIRGEGTENKLLRLIDKRGSTKGGNCSG